MASLSRICDDKSPDLGFDWAIALSFPDRVTSHRGWDLGSGKGAVCKPHALEAASILALVWLGALVGATVMLLRLLNSQTLLDAVLLEIASVLAMEV